MTNQNSSADSPNPPVRLALDVMGSDNGAPGIVRGGILAAEKFGQRIHIVLVGDQTQILPELAKLDVRPPNISVVHAAGEIKMTETPSEAVRKKDTSVAVGLNLHKAGEVDGFISTGNTGAVMAGSLLVLGRVKGVNRPAICAIFPTKDFRRTCPVLDVGANTMCKPINLLQFAVMGSAFVSAMYDIEKPRVGLLSIGEERSKGNELIVRSNELLEKSSLNFIGNVEGRDILSGDADVVVTDGFTGNIVLKFAESIAPFLNTRIKHQVATNIFSRIGAALMYPFLIRLRRAFDYAESGGAPLLGINGVVFICHGSSSPRAIMNGIELALKMVERKVLEKTRETLNQNDSLQIDASRHALAREAKDSTLETSNG